MDAGKRIKSRRRRLAQARGAAAAGKLRMAFTVASVCAVMGFAGIMGVEAFAGKAVAADEITQLRVTIHAGDTLWSIAANYADDGSDIRAYVREIAELNDLDGNTIYAGHTILVPVRKSNS